MAQELSRWVGLADRTEFRAGDAAALPCGDGAFDLVWCENAQMNLPDKAGFYDLA